MGELDKAEYQKKTRTRNVKWVLGRDSKDVCHREGVATTTEAE